MEWTWITGTVVAGFEGLAILTVFHAIMHVRTAQGTTAWVISLVAFPFIALPLYWIFGRSKFHGYIKARQSGDRQVKGFAERFRERYGGLKPFTPEELQYTHVLEELSNLPFSAYNRTRLLLNGEAAFAAIFRAIEAARDYVLVQFFIIRPDSVGLDLQQRLIQKAQRGIRVYMLYDELGCHQLNRAYLRRLREAGVVVSGFKSTSGRWNRFQLNFRNHRKIVIIDGDLAYVGGMNVGEEYLGRSRRFGPWRDTNVEVEGPAVECFQVSFVEDWYWATKIVPQLKWESERATSESKRILVLPTGPADRLETCAMFFAHSINAARRRVWIASPYFVPDSQIMACLQLAAIRGVDVRIMLPGKPDHILVYLSSFAYIKEVEPIGVKFYRYQEGFLHQKVLLVDDHIAAVGTANLDNRSLRLNFEITMAVVDEGFAAEIAEMLERDFAGCRRVDSREFDRKSFWFKLAVGGAKLLAPIQ